jgi:RNA polymerase sigma-70 factor (ECF subfamily)
MTSVLFNASQTSPEVTVASLDDHLIERMRQNDEGAYRLLVERHIDRAYGLALRILRSPADAEDVAQEAFVKAWIHRDKWQAGRAKFSTWLYRVIVNRCLDLKRRPVSANIDSVAEPIDPTADALTLIERSEQQQALAQAIAALPERQRSAIALTYTTGLKNAAAAEVMEMSVKAFEALLVRAKRSLRSQLTGESLGELD